MSKKHFTRIASALATRRSVLPADQRWIVDQIANDLADELGEFNAHFDRARFLTACGVA